MGGAITLRVGSDQNQNGEIQIPDNHLVVRAGTGKCDSIHNGTRLKIKGEGLEAEGGFILLNDHCFQWIQDFFESI